MAENTLESVPKAPGRIPGLGHLAALARGPLAFLVSLRKAGDLVRVDLGPASVYFITAPELHREALTTQAGGMVRGRIYERAKALFGDGLATSTGKHHLRQRRLIQPMFHRNRIEEYATAMAIRARETTASWQDGKTVAFDQLMHELMLEIVVDALVSRDIGRNAAAEIHQLMPVIMKGIPVRMITPRQLDGLPFPPSNRRFDAASLRLRDLVGELITNYRADPQETTSDLLTLLVSAQDEETGEGMTDEQICDEVVSLLMAGTETPSSTLAWFFHELAQNPEVERQLHEEIDEIVGTEPMTLEKIPKLEYTGRVITEVLRLHPTLLFTLRTTETVTLGGFEFPPGVELAYSPYALHRDPKTYPEPERFNPDRWIGADAKQARATFAPFNLGSHKCIGEGFAWTEIMITVVTIAAKWKLRPPDDTMIKEVPAIVPRPKALPMRTFAR